MGVRGSEGESGREGYLWPSTFCCTGRGTHRRVDQWMNDVITNQVKHGIPSSPLHSLSHITPSSLPRIITPHHPHSLASSHPTALTPSQHHTLPPSLPHSLTSSHPTALTPSHHHTPPPSLPHIITPYHPHSLTLPAVSFGLLWQHCSVPLPQYWGP